MVVAIEPMINMGTKTSNNWKMAGQFDCRRKTKCSFWAWCCSYWWETWNTIHFCLYQALGIVSNEEDEFRKYLSIVMKKLFKLVLNTIPRPLLIRLLM
jgi:methionine aminopeptidase